MNKRGYDSISSMVFADKSPVNSLIPEKILIIKTAIMGPVEAIPTKPKLSSSDSFPALFENNPMASDEIKGTVRTPVVAPGASKEIEINSGGAINASINIIE